MDPIKITIGGVCGVLVIAGGSALALISGNPWTLEQAIKEGKMANHSTEYTSEKLGGVGNNKQFLVANISENENWFNHIFDSKLKKLNDSDANNRAESTYFQAVTKGYSTSETTALNKVCDTAYQAAKTSFSTQTTGSDADKNKYYKDVISFCTVFGTGTLSI